MSYSVGVTVIIPTWRRAEPLGRALKAVEDQTQPAEEIVVVGRPDDDEAQLVVEQFRAEAAAAIHWIDNTRPGYFAPVALGVAKAGGEIVAFLDDDAEPEPGWLATMTAHFSDGDVACVGTRVITPGSRVQARKDAGTVRWYGRYIGHIGELDVPGPIDVDAVMEGSSAWRTAVLRSLDFDSRFDRPDAIMYGIDLSLQAKARGYRIVYEPRTWIVHHQGSTDPALDRLDRPNRVLGISRNYTLIALKHLRGVRRAAFIAWWWLVGERISYGIVKGAADLVLKGREVVPLFRAAWRGKWQGLQAWRE